MGVGVDGLVEGWQESIFVGLVPSHAAFSLPSLPRNTDQSDHGGCGDYSVVVVVVSLVQMADG